MDLGGQYLSQPMLELLQSGARESRIKGPLLALVAGGKGKKKPFNHFTAPCEV